VGHVIWTDPALDDLKRTGEYIAQHSPTYAVRVMERILEATRRLERFPRIGQVVPEFGQEDLREILCAPYRILYRVCPGACYILGIVHGRRDLVTAFDPHDE
jgi:plasmid stabilization system protein ParE